MVVAPRMFFPGAVIGLLLAVGGCEKSDYQACADQGIVAGSKNFENCMSKRQLQHAANARAAAAVLDEGSSSHQQGMQSLGGRYVGGCDVSNPKLNCTQGN